MKKTLLLCILFLCIGKPVASARPSFHFGLEWGAGCCIAEFHHFNYVSEDGRVNDKSGSLCFRPNAYIHAYAGMGLDEHWLLALKTGYEGVYVDRTMLPVLLKLQYSVNTFDKDGGFTFIEAGPDIPVINKSSGKVCATGSVGGGYRLALTQKTSIDFNAGFRISYDRPGIWDEYNYVWVPEKDIMRNNALYFGLTLGIGLNF